MAYVVKASKPVPRQVRAVTRQRLKLAIGLLDTLADADTVTDAPDVEAAVHEVRKRCKEVRALARLVRRSIGDDSYRRFNELVRDAAEVLAPIRDAHAVLETFDDLRAAQQLGADADLDRVRAAQLANAERATTVAGSGNERIGEARQKLDEARDGVKRWDVEGGFDALAPGIEDVYRRGRKALGQAQSDPSDECLHEWRKSAKHLWYAVRLVEDAAPSVLEPLVDRLSDLADALGDDHDLAVLVEHLLADPRRYGGKRRVDVAVELARRQQDDLRRRAFRLGLTLYAERPRQFRRRIEQYWACSVERGHELPTGGVAELAAERDRHGGGAAERAVASRHRRRFLVTGVPPLTSGGSDFRLGFLAIDGLVAVRVCDAGDDGCTLTIRAGRGAVRTELEWPIDEDQFGAAWEQTKGRRIHTTRHELSHGEHVIDVDVFHDELDGLVLAEVEFASERSMGLFQPPDWCTREVTGETAFSDAALAVNAPAGRP